MSTIFDEIVAGTRDSWTVWEDEGHLAFLTPFPNTPGFTVVIPKTNLGDDVFELDEDGYTALLLATRTVARLLKRALGVARVALVFEGTGVAYVHAKLIPLHGPKAAETGMWGDETEFVEEYRGYLTTLEGPPMPDDELRRIQERIRSAL